MTPSEPSLTLTVPEWVLSGLLDQAEQGESAPDRLERRALRELRRIVDEARREQT